ncbi:MAG: DNA alkylation repair protein [Bacteroidaceae bacterium]|nr:DNA alkylation repair protein [Bacteroidaceae bacterium]
MNEYIHDKIKEIKKSLRLSMNGIVSAHQRRQGLNYKINFGVEIPRIREIAKRYTKDITLAQELWKDNIRECKILAIYLYPENLFDTETAEKWIAECPFTEIADHLCRTLLKNLPQAKEKALSLITDSNEMSIYCGYSTLSNLFREGTSLNKEEESIYVNGIKKVLLSNKEVSHPIQNCASISLQKYSEQGKEQTARICKEIKSWNIENNEALKLLIANIEEE